MKTGFLWAGAQDEQLADPEEICADSTFNAGLKAEGWQTRRDVRTPDTLRVSPPPLSDFSRPLCPSLSRSPLPSSWCSLINPPDGSSTLFIPPALLPLFPPRTQHFVCEGQFVRGSRFRVFEGYRVLIYWSEAVDHSIEQDQDVTGKNHLFAFNLYLWFLPDNNPLQGLVSHRFWLFFFVFVFQLY